MFIEIKLLSKVTLQGRLASSFSEDASHLVEVIPLVELCSYVNTDSILSELKPHINSAKNTTNKKKVVDIQSDLNKWVQSGGVGVLPSLVVAIHGNVELKNEKKKTQLSFDSSGAYVIGNLLTYNALLGLLGIKAPLFSSRLSSSDISTNSFSRQKLATMDVLVTFVFDNKGLTAQDIKNLFFKYNRQNPDIHLTQFTNEESIPLASIIERLSTRLKLDDFGGISKDSKHVKAGEPYISTEYILFKVIAGVVAGAQALEYAKVSEDFKLSDGHMLSQTCSEHHLDYIVSFFQSWLEPLRDNITSREGFRLSAQIWQALSLVVRELYIHETPLLEVKQIAYTLGQLNYGKQALHWANCDVMGLDSNGRLFKNSAKSTRAFREGLASYFIKIAKQPS